MRREKIPGVMLYHEFMAADGHKVRFDFEPWLKPSADLDAAMDEAASKLAFAGAFHGLMVEADEVLDSEYRSWRATQGENILGMDKSGKMSEHKIKQLIESAPEFLEWKRKTAKMAGALRSMDVIVRALANMADMLRSRGANRRAEMHSLGMSTPEQEDGDRGAADHDHQRGEDDGHEQRERRVAEAVAETNHRRTRE